MQLTDLETTEGTDPVGRKMYAPEVCKVRGEVIQCM